MKKLLLILGLITLIGGTALAQAGSVPDPMSIGVGARALGMGRAYVAVAEDSDALFMNPAGIAISGNAKLSSMYTSLLNDVNYTVVGGIYPYGEKSAVGAGIINSSSSNILLMDSDGTPSGTGHWSNTVLFLSAATYISGLAPFKNVDSDILIGGSFKYFNTGGSGSNDVAEVADAAGTGYSADLGLLYPATDFLTLGVNAQNIMASKLTRSGGINEDIPANIKVGGKLCLIGKEGKSYTIHDNRRLYLNADYDLNALVPEEAAHLGLEFWPVGNLAFRVGQDGQNMTAGVGVRLAGVEFNYAYHPYTGVDENATSFFSISYLGESLRRMLRVQLDSPSDKAIIYDDHIKVSGRVEVIDGDETQLPAGVVSVKVNGVTIPVGTDMTFAADVPVDNVGKKILLIEASDAAGDYFAEERKLVRLINFADVPEGYWAKAPIENTGTVGLVEGYPDGTFKPERTLTRAELATLMVRARGIKLPDRVASRVFKDVASDFWGAKYIAVAQDAGLVEGYPDGTFRPNNRINKAEGIAILVRFENLRVASEVFEKPYWDVSTKYWGARYIQAAKEYGMLKFVQRNYLEPMAELPRAEAVEMFAKTSLAGAEIQDLYTWEKGFKPSVTPERPSIQGMKQEVPLQAQASL